jgi:heterotetrameric sarcosine oxidase gamma subunit
MIRAELESEAALGRKLEAAFAFVPDADVAPVSDMHSAFRIAGPGAEEVLRQGAPLNLSLGAFPENCVAATEIWAVTAIISRDQSTEPSFTMLVDNSFAGYIADWLSVANGGSPAASPGVMTNPPRPLAP